MERILLREETLDPSFVPPTLPHREKELQALARRYRESLGRGLPYHHLLTGGVGSGKTALALRLAEELRRVGRVGSLPIQRLYVNCWRRSNDRALLLELLRAVGVSLPDRGYALAEMLDVFEQGIRRNPGHLFVVLDEVSALVRQGTRLVYLLTRGREVGLGSISLFLVAPEDVLPYLDAASRSSFGVTHRLQLAAYDAPALRDILASRAALALRPGSYSDEVLEPIARTAAATGDARFALELLLGAARAADADGLEEIGPEQVRAAKGSLYPTVSETKLGELELNELFVLLAVARSLRGPRSTASSEQARQTYRALAEEYGIKAMSRVSFWRTVQRLDREGLVDIHPAEVGRAARLAMNELPASYLELVLEEKVAGRRLGKA
jgi:cell division control protein 6